MHDQSAVGVQQYEDALSIVTYHRNAVATGEKVDHLALFETRQAELLRILTQDLNVFETASSKALSGDIEKRLAQIDQIDLRKLVDGEILGHLLDVPTSTTANVNPDQGPARLGAAHLVELSSAESAVDTEHDGISTSSSQLSFI